MTPEGKDADNFELPNSSSITWMEEGWGYFSPINIAPKTGLRAGSYSAKLKVQGTNTPAVSISVKFTVNGSSFVIVTDITGIPNTVMIGEPLALKGKVEPENATNQTIVWGVSDAGNTGAKIDNGILSATVAGTVQVKAEITDGLASGQPYEKTFQITVTSTAPAFVAVNTIKDVPASMTVEEFLTLKGTVEPETPPIKILYGVLPVRTV